MADVSLPSKKYRTLPPGRIIRETQNCNKDIQKDDECNKRYQDKNHGNYRLLSIVMNIDITKYDRVSSEIGIVRLV